MRVLTWNLFHGRAVPSAGRDLLAEFASTLAWWQWDVALLQEVPPWWPPELAAAAGADHRAVLTSRHELLPVRRALAQRWPDVIRSSGGGANAILVRGTIAEHRVRRLRVWPERRYVHGVRADDTWFVNVHAHNRPEARAWTDDIVALATARAWAGRAPLVFGGDLNVKEPVFTGMRHVAGNHVDHLFTDGRGPSHAEVVDRGALSDHPPVAVTLA
jgi:endonuclease/exonuclease/phosphatase family metal-dependent hydrolase